MHAAFIAAALAATTLAKPFHKHHQRDVVWDIDYFTVTDYVTVTEDAPAPSSTKVTTPQLAYGHNHFSGFPQSYPWYRASSVETSTAAAVTADAAPSSAPASTYTEQPWTTQAPPTEQPTTTQAPPTEQPTSDQAPPSTDTPTQAPTTTWAASSWSSPSASPPASPPASTPASGGSLTLASDSYKDIVVYHHNIHRANHSSQMLVWNDTMAQGAAAIAATCNYAHNTSPQYCPDGCGQNIAAGVDAANISEIITGLFYNGEVAAFDDLYGKAQPDMTNFEIWGHFSQIVWNSTTSVGCATQVCDSLANAPGISPVFTVCNYYPPGNYANQYAANIKQPSPPQDTAQWNAGGISASGATS